MEKTVNIENPSLISHIVGPYDENLCLIKEKFNINLFVEKNGFCIKGNKEEELKKTEKLLRQLIKFKEPITKQMIQQHIQSLQSGDTKSDYGRIKISSKKKFIVPRTEGQNRYINSIKSQDLVFSIGPAGTGKTYLAMAMAANYLIRNKIRRIILTRPAIEAGESLGFLPGNMNQKLSPYLRPLYDALYDMMDVQIIERYLEMGIIEVAPLAYMRGRTLNNAFIVLDEAQNCTREQLKMFLTRLGFDSKAVVTGDVTQSDLPGGRPEGLIYTLDILRNIKSIDIVNLTGKDVVRHPLVQSIIGAYDRAEEKK